MNDTGVSDAGDAGVNDVGDTGLSDAGDAVDAELSGKDLRGQCRSAFFVAVVDFVQMKVSPDTPSDMVSGEVHSPSPGPVEQERGVQSREGRRPRVQSREGRI